MINHEIFMPGFSGNEHQLNFKNKLKTETAQKRVLLSPHGKTKDNKG
jgi:hypothetical protein